jgi:hypothetical protein
VSVPRFPFPRCHPLVRTPSVPFAPNYTRKHTECGNGTPCLILSSSRTNRTRTQDCADSPPFCAAASIQAQKKCGSRRAYPLPHPSPPFARKVGTEKVYRLPPFSRPCNKNMNKGLYGTRPRPFCPHPRLCVKGMELCIPMKPCTCDPSGKRRRELLASSISWQGLGLVLNRAR